VNELILGGDGLIGATLVAALQGKGHRVVSLDLKSGCDLRRPFSLTPFEEADGLQALAERFGYTHEDIAKRIGKSRSSISEALSLATMPPEVREECRRAEIRSKTTLLEIGRQPTVEEMIELAKKISSTGLTRDEARLERKGPTGKPNSNGYRYVSREGDFSVSVKFKRQEAGDADIEAALREALKNLAGEE